MISTPKEILRKIFPYAISEQEKVYAELEQKDKKSNDSTELTSYYIVTQRKLLRFYFNESESKVGYKCLALNLFSHCEEKMVTKGEIEECNPDSDYWEDMPKKYEIRLVFNVSDSQLEEVKLTLESVNDVKQVKDFQNFMKGFYEAIACNEN